MLSLCRLEPEISSVGLPLNIWHLAFSIWHLAFGIWHSAFIIRHSSAILPGMPHRPSTGAQGAPINVEGRAPGAADHGPGQYLKRKPLRYHRPRRSVE